MSESNPLLATLEAGGHGPKGQYTMLIDALARLAMAGWGGPDYTRAVCDRIEALVAVPDSAIPF